MTRFEKIKAATWYITRSTVDPIGTGPEINGVDTRCNREPKLISIRCICIHAIPHRYVAMKVFLVDEQKTLRTLYT
jgi:hypothetical protein